MRRITMILLAVGLLILWNLERNQTGASSGAATDVHFSTAVAWMTWLDLAAAIGAVFAAVPALLTTTNWARVLSSGLFGLALLGWLAGAPAWMALGNFAYSLAFCLAVVLRNRNIPEQPALPGQRPLNGSQSNRAA